jgi:putative Holliday junction resolvase
MPDATLLAFDFGIKRIGVAIGDTFLRQARALTTVNAEANDARFALIATLIKEWQPTRLLVGRPLNEDGSPHDMTARCERFAQQLSGRFHLPVDQVDERFSSVEADTALRSQKLNWQERKEKIDAEAARIILQDWLDACPIQERNARAAA